MAQKRYQSFTDYSTPAGESNRPPVLRLLKPLCLLSLLLLVIFNISLFINQRTNSQQTENSIIGDAINSFNYSIQRQAKALAA